MKRKDIRPSERFHGGDSKGFTVFGAYVRTDPKELTGSRAQGKASSRDYPSLRNKGRLTGMTGEDLTSCIILSRFVRGQRAVDGYYRGRLRADVYAIYKGQPYHGFIGDWNWNESVSMRRVKRFPKGVVL